MNRNNWNDLYRIRQGMNRDIAREFERYHLQDQALSGKPRRPFMLARAIGGLGTLLVSAGTALQGWTARSSRLPVASVKVPND